MNLDQLVLESAKPAFNNWTDIIAGVTFSQDDIERGIIENVIRYVCPLCAADMFIAGRFDRESREVEGKSKVMQHVCLKCDKIVIPKKV